MAKLITDTFTTYVKGKTFVTVRASNQTPMRIDVNSSYDTNASIAVLDKMIADLKRIRTAINDDRDYRKDSDPVE